MNNPDDTTRMPGIHAENVSKVYQLERMRIDVLKGVSINVKPGETVSIMGASGAGKSTLLHTLGGLDEPSGGRIRLDGEDVYQASSSRRNQLRALSFGFVFQAFHLLPELDVLDNITLPAMSQRGALKHRGELLERGRYLLKSVGLDHRMAHRPLELSGGEQQRAAIARALMNKPRFVMADEPTGNLDSVTGQLVLDTLFDLIKGESASLVIVTHNLEVAKRCHTRLVLKDGILADHGL